MELSEAAVLPVRLQRLKGGQPAADTVLFGSAHLQSEVKNRNNCEIEHIVMKPL